ncbi:MAG: hypothetical protein DYG90_04035 [Chloroflexi bacterium CFX6]|nr:hypothetical protein [Chloroflexi bacterium CFX6]
MPGRRRALVVAGSRVRIPVPRRAPSRPAGCPWPRSRRLATARRPGGWRRPAAPPRARARRPRGWSRAGARRGG